MSERKATIDWISLLIGIFFIICAFIAFKDPYASLASLVIYFGILAILKGVGSFIIYRNIKEYTNLNIRFFLCISIIDIVLGTILMFNIESAVSFIPYIFAIWFIIDSINDLSLGKYLRFVPGRLYGIHIAINILTLLLGISMFYNPLSTSFTIVYLIGMYFTVSGIKYITYAFKHKY